MWATHERRSLLTPILRPLVFQYLRDQAHRHHFRLTDIGGWNDHLHIFPALPPNQTPAKTIQLLKGESTHWLNVQKMTSAPFRWQSNYWAGSVSPSGLTRSRTYIAGQEEHHRAHSFAEECTALFNSLGIVQP